MNEKLSALMDGELDRTDALAAIKTLGQDAQQRGDWDCYHLIGDAIRGDTSSVTARRKACAESIFARLADEPTILAPAAAVAIASSVKLSVVTKPAVVEKKTRMVLAMAASVVTVTAIGVIALKQQDRQQDTATAPAQVAKQMPAPTYAELTTVSTAPTAVASEVEANKQRVNDYLVIHRQFANSSALRAASTSTTQAEPRQAAAQ
jgi:sigma-E factor negative regulatory protein RseA